MVTAPPKGLLSVYADLEEAENGINGFGSYTAEIYAYRLHSHSPSRGADFGHISEEANRQAAEEAAESLQGLISMLVEDHSYKGDVYVNGAKIVDKGALVEEVPPTNHRWHVFFD